MFYYEISHFKHNLGVRHLNWNGVVKSQLLSKYLFIHEVHVMHLQLILSEQLANTLHILRYHTARKAHPI